MTEQFKWSVVSLPHSPQTTDPKERLKELVECLEFQNTEIMAHYADLERVLAGPQEEIDAFMELVGMKEEERTDICTMIFALLAECRDTARPSTPEERQAVEESVAQFRESLQRHEQKIKAQLAQQQME